MAWDENHIKTRWLCQRVESFSVIGPISPNREAGRRSWFALQFLPEFAKGKNKRQAISPPLLIPESFDRIDVRCFHRRIDPKSHTYRERYAERNDHRSRSDDRLPLRRQSNNPGYEKSQADPH